MEDRKTVSVYVAKKKPEILSFLKACVAVDTTNPPGKNYLPMVHVLERFLKKKGFSTKRVVVPESFLKEHGITEGDPRVCLIADWDVGAKKTLLIQGHYDVVPATNKWKTAPFKPVVKGNRMFGRGVFDQKGEFAANIFAVLSLKENKIRPGCNIMLVFTPDEEIGGKTGFGYLVEKGFVKPDYALGEGMHKEQIGIGNKGLVWVEIAVYGKACHGSQPYKGVNAFEGMLKITDELRLLQRKVEKRKTRYPTKRAEEKAATFVMGGILKGGSKANVVPDRVVFSIDRRVLPEEKVGEVIKEIKDAVRRAMKKDSKVRAEVKILALDKPVTVPQEYLVKEFSKAVEKVYGKKGKGLLMTGGTDMKFLLRKGIPAIGHTVNGGNLHGDDEWLDLRDLMKVIELRAYFFKELK